MHDIKEIVCFELSSILRNHCSTSSRTAEDRHKMISNLADKDLTTKNGHTGADKITSRSRFWLGLKDPRIVRVSRAFGGKDRHSKVSTIKGLRDRRVRLSVQTAIQLYDLQDKLGLSQPSKVVDWLLNAAQDEIDKLPPLPMSPFMHNFSQTALASTDEAEAPQWQAYEKLKHENSAQSAAVSHQLALSSAKRSNLGNDRVIQDAIEFTKSAVISWNSGVTADGKTLEGEAPPADHAGFEKPTHSSKAADAQNFSAQALANFPFSRLTHSSFPGLTQGNLPYATPFYHLETAANAYDQHLLGSHPSKLLEAAASNPSMQSQLVFCASGGMPMFSSFLTGAELNPKQYHIQLAAASPSLQLGSVASHQSTAGVALARPSPASLALRHDYSDS